MRKFLIPLLAISLLSACNKKVEPTTEKNMEEKVAEFAPFKLTSNIDDLSANQKEMLTLFFEVAKIMDGLFWQQAYGSKHEAMQLSEDEFTREFIKLNYGPWERLNGNKSFIESIGEKPVGAQFYPTNMSKEEFESLESEDKTSLYTIITRNDEGKLESVPYHVYYKTQIEKAAELLKKASCLAEDKGFRTYLELRAEALLTDDYLESDLVWMDMKTNRIDFVVGPIENYEDQLFGYKAAYEAYILLKDMEWSDRLSRFSSLLPELQKKLPVDPEYKKEVPGSGSDLGAYDVVFYAGDCNAGSKTIAINLPNDPRVHKAKGSRRLQLKNAMQAKFDKILVPIAQELIDPSQIDHVTFDAFFENTMFHEVAHGIGVHYLINDNSVEVGSALKEKNSSLEEGKADILGIFIIDELVKMGELDTDPKNNYVTFTAGLFRSIRFGSTSAHGIANLVRYNYFKEKEAFTRSTRGMYTVNFDKMGIAVEQLSKEILTIQGDGNYEAAVKMIEKYGNLSEELKTDLERINSKGIPVDVIFEQGPEILGLTACNPEKCEKAPECAKEH
ncbi:MAG: Zn-dependent hydrolase [Bacteroidales bacterium]|nr:Zn-dependent hydrolase [Bacteroidales bacterium]MBN2817875.1 Zn-dependent hydrolase [Bacteroidales bacterium]